VAPVHSLRSYVLCPWMKGRPLRVQDWLWVVAVAYRTGAEVWTDDDLTVRRVRGGANNALYQVESGGKQYACKLCVVDDRNRAAREYGALSLLRSAGLDLAPRPVLLDDSRSVLPFPAVVYRWLPGGPLGPTLAAEQLAAVLESFQQIHALRRGLSLADALPDACFHWFGFSPYLAELRGFLAQYGHWLAACEPNGRDLRDRLVHLVERCADALSSTPARPGRGRFPLCLCRVDPNLANTVWDGTGPLRWVDWEYAGWGDAALDLADLRWHVALEGLSQDQHAWLRDRYVRPEDDAGFDRRLNAWDHLLSTRWPLLLLRALWSACNGPDRVRLTCPETGPEELRAQLVRTLERAEAHIM
jgi:aminoglycoside phosphotransferase (APT) family kinase protein